MNGRPRSSDSVQALKPLKYRGRFLELMNVARVSRSQNLIRESADVISRSGSLMTWAEALVTMIRGRRANG